MLAIIKYEKSLPEFKNRAKSHIENSAKQRSKLYILTSCAYLISEPLTAKNVKASAIDGLDKLNCRHNKRKGITESIENKTGKNLNQKKLSPPTEIQIFSKI